MSKILVNAPSGEQEIITVGEGGGYFDESRVLWDERVDGLMPEIVYLGAMVRNGDDLEYSESAKTDYDSSIANPRALEEKKQAIVEIMIEKQDGGIVFNGLPVATDEAAKSDLVGARLKPKAARKIVTRKGGGQRLSMTDIALEALFNAVEKYRQDVMDCAFDKLEQLESDGVDPKTFDVGSGWPSNTIESA